MRVKTGWRALVLVCGLMLASTAQATPSLAEVKAAWLASDVVYVDRHGEEIQRLRRDKQARRQDWVSLAEMSPALRHALVLSEDRRFYQHSGVDWSGVAAAAWANLWNTRTRGASTLTMQLAGLLDAELKAGAGGRSVWQKLGQGWSAVALERHWRKAEILEAYLNLVSFRGELVGVGAVSRALFDKLPDGLNRQEAAILAALLRGPNADAATLSRRACTVYQDMQADEAVQLHLPAPDAAAGQRACQQLTLLTQQALGRRQGGQALTVQLAPHFARKLAEQRRDPAGRVVRTTLDARLQRLAAAVLHRHLASLARRHVEDGAVLVLDNASGDILAWVGSSGELSAAREVDGVTAPRQAGSTLKPFLYQLALQQRYLTAAALLDDSPLDMATAGGLYSPQNYSRDFKGLVSVRSALGASLNIPAVRTVAMVSPRLLRDRLHALGLGTLTRDGDFYGYSLALGAADVRLLDLTNAYRTLAQGGLASPPRWTLDAPPARPVRLLDAASSFIIADILADRGARSRTFGLESALSTRYWSAVKTGTSKDMRDNWALGFSRRYTVGVWVGNASGQPMWDVSGMHGAAPVWLDVLNALHQHTPSPPPAPPAGVQRQRVHYADEVEAEREEYFLAGSEQREIVAVRASDSQPPGIVSPLPGSVYAIDPDIPPKHQRLLLRARGVPGAQWRIDGRPAGQGDAVPWFPWPGRHRLALLNAQGQPVQTLTFDVRGAVAKPGARPPR
jgi:penicillin-binding protein 1C